MADTPNEFDAWSQLAPSRGTDRVSPTVRHARPDTTGKWQA
jgi:hypothetical protein